jgi:hypothetical protein
MDVFILFRVNTPSLEVFVHTCRIRMLRNYFMGHTAVSIQNAGELLKSPN